MPKLYLYAAFALSLAGGLWYVHHLQVRAGERDAYKAQAERLQADYQALKVESARQVKIATEASNAYQKDLARLDTERASVPVVRLCRNATKPSLPADSPATSGSDAASTPDASLTASADIGDALIEYGIACEANMLQLTRLQEWVRAR